MAGSVVGWDDGSESARAPIGLGIDITTSSRLPTRAADTPLCLLPELRVEPHAWVKLPERPAAHGMGGTR